jgi:hypothetical protein
MKLTKISQPQVVCPKCNTPMKLTDSLVAPLVVKLRKQLEQQMARKGGDFAKREAKLRKSQQALASARNEIDSKVAKQLERERASISKSESQKARTALAAELRQRDRQLEELQENLESNNAKLSEAQKAHANMLRKSRELDIAKRELDLSVQRKVQESLATVREQVKAEVEDNLRLKLAERETRIGGLQRQIEELSRKAEQGSQQLQGETLELELETLLRNRFPQDLIEPVPKGELGGDILQSVRGADGQLSGVMLWETKNTKTWKPDWLAKLRANQRSVQAEVALLVSTSLPKEIETFDLVDGIWVTKLRFAIPLAAILRQTLIDLARNKRAAQGQQVKMEMVYQYLTGPRFRNRIESIVEKFTDMQVDLDRERKLMTRMWAKREEQLRGVLDSSSGLYGDLQGITGRVMIEIDGLEPLLIDGNSSSP